MSCIVACVPDQRCVAFRARSRSNSETLGKRHERRRERGQIHRCFGGCGRISDHRGTGANLNMCKAALACLLVLIPCSLCAHERKADWQALYGLHSGGKIELIETGMKKHVGIFSAVSEEAIEMREGSNDIGIRKESVVRVTVLDKSHRLRNSLLLGGGGAGAGAGIGAAASRCSNANNTFNFCGLGRSVAVGIGAVAVLLGGAGVGAAIPSHPTIYRAEAAKSRSNALPDGSNQESMRQ